MDNKEYIVTLYGENYISALELLYDTIWYVRFWPDGGIKTLLFRWPAHSAIISPENHPSADSPIGLRPPGWRKKARGSSKKKSGRVKS